MGRLYENFTLVATRKKKVRALIDSGADMSLIRGDVAYAIGAELTGEHMVGEVVGGMKQTMPVVSFRIIRKGRYVSMFAAIAKIREPLLIGNNFLQDNSYRLDFRKDKIEFKGNAPQIRHVYRI